MTANRIPTAHPMDLLLVIFAAGLGYTAYSIVEKRVLNGVAIGRKVLLTYADQNNEMKSELQWTGIVQRKLRIGNKSDNFVINLNEPIIHHNSVFSEVVVRERRLGNYIGSNKPTAVQLLLPKQGMRKDKYKWDAFDHVGGLTLYLQ
ncbi:hypothetical protein SAMN04488109_6020 [Chryseolinea serpens]|uniref:Uncharacterized protein n=2 Tax=Chryseolinea serpens TaxID=947013 RepID=A0A1M5WTW4_9BACT|nr:hypothetical protein SAMN04488109_6020 [Chryseolinea serpens]